MLVDCIELKDKESESTKNGNYNQKIKTIAKKHYSYKHKLNYLNVKLILENLRPKLAKFGRNLGKIIKTVLI